MAVKLIAGWSLSFFSMRCRCWWGVIFSGATVYSISKFIRVTYVASVVGFARDQNTSCEWVRLPMANCFMKPTALSLVV